MKIYFFIAALAVCALLASCSNDAYDEVTKQPTKVINFENDAIFGKEIDSLSDGEPIPPKRKD